MAPAEALTAAERARFMGNRLLDTMRGGLIAPGAVELVLSAYALAAEKRAASLTVKDTRLLHPGRTVLILWQDCSIRDAGQLAAAALVESQDLELRADVLAFPATPVARCVQSIPSPVEAGDRLLEDLLALDPAAARIALAERLDHLRHLHLGSRDNWAREFQLATQIYLPVAQRTDNALARRFTGWCELFEKHRL